MPNPKVVHTYTYGTSEIVGYRSPWRIEIYRPFNPHPKEPWNAEVTERCMALNAADTSPRHDKSVRYDSACSCCYLNITHTEALHKSRL